MRSHFTRCTARKLGPKTPAELGLLATVNASVSSTWSSSLARSSVSAGVDMCPPFLADVVTTDATLSRKNVATVERLGETCGTRKARMRLRRGEARRCGPRRREHSPDSIRPPDRTKRGLAPRESPASLTHDQVEEDPCQQFQGTLYREAQALWLKLRHYYIECPGIPSRTRCRGTSRVPVTTCSASGTGRGTHGLTPIAPPRPARRTLR